jgi:hypothetical protein
MIDEESPSDPFFRIRAEVVSEFQTNGPMPWSRRASDASRLHFFKNPTRSGS